MSEDNTKTSVTKNSDLTRNKETEANSWIIGVSRSHPGQKYYFNTVTGVSLWNISDEDIERAQQQMKTSGSPHQYVNFPEPKEPPPARRMPKLFTQMHCQHSVKTPRTSIKHLINNELMSDDLHTPENHVYSNFRPCPYPDCTPKPLRHINVMPQSRMKSPPILDGKMFERSATQHAQHSSTSNHMLGGRMSPKKHIAEIVRQDVPKDETHSQSSNDNEWIEESHSEFDLALLKKFAKSDTFEDKWYIIPDASVYLQDINLITTILDNDEKCCVVVTQNVRNELDNATKTPLKAKAHYANYIIYKLLHLGFAITDDDILKQNQDITNNTSVLNCCLKLKEQNFYVVVITSDVELEKYGHFHVPIFTLRDLKKCLTKPNHFVVTKSPLPSLTAPQMNNKTLINKLNTLNTGMPSNTRMSDKFNMKRTNSDLTEENILDIRSSFVFNGTSINSSMDFKDVTKTTTDAEVQTDLTLTQLQEMEDMYRKTCLSKIDDSKKKESENLLGHNQSYDSSLRSSNRVTNKHIKLKRWKIREQPKLQHHANVNESYSQPKNNDNISPPAPSVFENKKIGDQTKSCSSIFPEYSSNNNKEQSLDVTDNASNCTIQELHNKDLNQQRIENNEDKNVMFEITTEMMEHNLKMKCDEWVTQFVQIMEKALTEVLRINSLCFSSWNLYKATVYIEKNIRDDVDILDASTKLLNVLNQVRDEKGNINTNMSPTTYMTMYSFGVYLIDALQGKFDTCDDLQIAAESLSKLLNDIQNLKLDPDDDKVEVLMIVDTDSLNDELFGNTEQQVIEEESNANEELTNDVGRKNNDIESSTNEVIETNFSSTNNARENNTVQFKVNIPCTGKTLSTEEATSTEIIVKSPSKGKCKGSPSTYNLRSRQRRMSVLHEKSKYDVSDPLNVTNEIADNVQSHNMEINEERENEINNDNSKFVDEVHTPNKEPKVIRNFVRCLEFEERLRTNQMHEELNDLDYEDEDMETEYIDEPSFDTRVVPEDLTEFYDDTKVMDYESNKEEIKFNLKYIITKIAKEIKDISSEVYVFSSRAKRSIILASEDKSDIREKAGHCYMYINKLCTALNSLLYRDRSGPYNMQLILDNSEFTGICVDEDQMEVYGEFVSSCLVQAQNLKEVIKDVLSALRKDEVTN
ncbi:uncharacterized protein [Epargyreus clarus]|uniref:uncharacterized protein isoform X2 n=1 Tax=Epargyreus clarus TaxID=520877 RepID=UPI003C2D1DB3